MSITGGDLIANITGGVFETTDVLDPTADTIEEAIKTKLSDATITAVVDLRVYPDILPQDTTLPAITYQQIGGFRGQVMDGVDGMVNARYQINCWDDTYEGARYLANVVNAVLNSFSGVVGTVKIFSMVFELEGDILNMSENTEVTKTYGKRLDFRIWFKE